MTGEYTKFFGALKTFKGVSDQELETLVRNKIMDSLSTEGKILLGVTKADDEVVMAEGGSHIIKFVNQDKGQTFFKYDPDFIFMESKNGYPMAIAEGVESRVNYSFEEDGRINVSYL